MIRRLLPCLLALACRHPEATYPRIAAPCSEARIGAVIVEGAAPSDVPQLAVLDGTLDDPARITRVTAIATDHLRARGYARATVEVTRRPGCGVELVARVTRGPRFRIAAIDFVTEDDLPRRTRLAAVEDALGTVNSVGGAYVHARLVRSLDTLARRYHEAGWLEAEIDPPRATFNERRGEVRVTIAIRAGRRFKIGHVIARGGGRSTRRVVIEALGLRGGQWYDAARVREGIVRARREIDQRLEMRMQVAADRVDLEAIVGDVP